MVTVGLGDLFTSANNHLAFLDPISGPLGFAFRSCTDHPDGPPPIGIDILKLGVLYGLTPVVISATLGRS
jgi:hypothetical protein